MKTKQLDYDYQLTRHFTLGEFLRSGKAVQLNIKNEPDAHKGEAITNEELLENLQRLCEEVLEPLRLRFGRILITSGYRCRELNKAVGGVFNSQHLRGEAADIFVSSTEMAMRYAEFLDKHTNVGQILLEPLGRKHKRWLHVGVGRN